jgi:hypothetical protein
MKHYTKPILGRLTFVRQDYPNKFRDRLVFATIAAVALWAIGPVIAADQVFTHRPNLQTETYRIAFAFHTILFGAVIYLLWLVYKETTSARFLVVWLRRFSLEPRNDFPLGQILSRATRRLARVVTVDDPSFSTSYESSWTSILNGSKVMGMWGLLVLIGFGLFILTEYWVGGFATVIVGLIVSYTVLGLGTSLGELFEVPSVTFSGSTASQEALKIVDKVKRTGTRFKDNLLAVICDDNVWRETVEVFLCVADAVIVELSDMSDNLFWEITTTLSKVSPDRIIFVCEVEKGCQEERLAQVLERFQSLEEHEKIKRCQKFYFSRNPFSRFVTGSQFDTLCGIMKEMLCHCVSKPVDPRLFMEEVDYRLKHMDVGTAAKVALPHSKEKLSHESALLVSAILAADAIIFIFLLWSGRIL